MNFLVDHADGLLGLSLGAKALVAFALVQVSMMAVTLYLHRDQAHRAIELHPAIRHFFRLWIWLTSGMVTREWVAVHRKHHAFCESVDDPHSPVTHGLRTILLRGAEVYRVETANEATLAKFGRGTPEDWLERHVYRHGLVGIYTTLLINVVLFGALGITMFALQMLAMPVFAAGVINGLGHAVGYRNFETEDASTNLVPIAVLIGGEELHNNHHAFPTSARFSLRRGEFDIGWFYIRALAAVGLCRIARVAPQPQIASQPRAVDIDTLRAVLQNRMHVLRDYSRRVTMPVLRMERRARRGDVLLRSAAGLLRRWPGKLDDASRQRLARILDSSPILHAVHEHRAQLMRVWQQANVSNERLVADLKEWCARAEASGIAVLEEFSARLRGYLPQPVSV
ncbi:MAG: fatty acid desaturase [Gammaproteobacteria bacterium]|nr:MAG: fatty acid desaturase [Gammaproteobacteria bacterium]